MRFVFNLERAHAENPEELDKAADSLVYPLLAATRRDKTGTFREMDEQEMLVFLRGMTFLVRSPLLEGSDLFATAKHRELVIDFMLRIFSNRPAGRGDPPIAE
ncbi:MAG: hypothetical protein WCJ41_19570 [Aestuariivirga sp.]|uniref:hypothetical protein n=1 Tax=Aestuariivirga sp. TaxID=2650926 RepID=UPI0030159612